MATMTGSNLQMAQNQQKSNAARASAESGLEVIRHWLSDVSLSGSPEERIEILAQELREVAPFAEIDDYDDEIIIENFVIDSTSGQSFAAQITITEDDEINVLVKGHANDFTRQINVKYGIEVATSDSANPFFGYGVASKGPFQIDGGTRIEGYNEPSEGSIYIEAQDINQTFSIGGSANISGNVNIANPDHTSVHLSGNPWIDGAAVQPWWPFNPNDFTEEEINDRGVYVNAEEIEFPTPDPHYFRQYATGPEITESMSSVYSLDNAVIKAGTNPTFTGDYSINGILYIEQPNTVTFGGSCEINAIIVAEGDHEDPLPGDKITWSGHVTNNGVQDPRFEGISIFAPGFELDIGATYDGGSDGFETFHGSIIGNGIKFSGDPQLNINGTVINYSDEPMSLEGSSRLRFNFEAASPNHAGFTSTSGTSEFELQYLPHSYTEVGF